MFQNLHTHTRFSDGSDDPEKYVEAAISQGLSALGFSDHSPLPFENTFALREEETVPYCESILNLREKFLPSGTPSPKSEIQNLKSEPERSGARRSQIRNLNRSEAELGGAKSEIPIFLGMEADYIPGTGHSFSYFRENYPLDYLIGSVHLVRNGSPRDLWFIDGPDPATYDDGLHLLFGGDIRKGVTAYYRQINEMLTGSPMDIIGHFDKIKMHNRGRFFLETDPWYLGLVNETLELVRQSGTIVEVNTRGIYKKRSDTLFPGPEILKIIHKMNIPVIISSDAHKPREVAMLFDETAGLLMEIGFSELMNLTSKGWDSVPLK